MASFVSAAAAVRCATRILRGSWPSIRRSTQRSAQVGSASRGGRSSVSTIFFGATVRWPRGSVPTRRPRQIWCRTWVCSSCAWKGRDLQDLGVCPKGFQVTQYSSVVEWSGQRDAAAAHNPHHYEIWICGVYT